ncbi:hypothetical protein [Microcoleus sp. S1D4]|uniref:hypothetical protein n=1 Tax=unclassified Microcoleus TaxID=2642155 RepID=UPI003FA5D0E1
MGASRLHATCANSLPTQNTELVLLGRVLKPVDIHEGVDSRLLILQGGLKSNGLIPGIEVIKD